MTLAHELQDVIGDVLVATNVRAAAAAHLERHTGESTALTVLEEIAAASASPAVMA